MTSNKEALERAIKITGMSIQLLEDSIEKFCNYTQKPREEYAGGRLEDLVYLKRKRAYLSFLLKKGLYE